jgi:hypothetical protein
MMPFDVETMAMPRPFKTRGMSETDAKARQENVGGEVLCYIY